jgi:hypothetical protein
MYYVAHRLFALHDRALGALVAEELARQVGEGAVFLSFCDTDEENLVAPCKGRRLFELDLERLRRLTGMIAVLHGPSLDDGVCMEMGFARRLGVRVVVLTTDFQTYGLQEKGPELAFPDPLVQAVATDIVRVHGLGAPGAGGRYESFLRQNVEPLAEAARTAVSLLLSQDRTEPQPACSAHQRVAFLEGSRYKNDTEMERMADVLMRNEWIVQRPERFHPRHRNLSDVIVSSLSDWNALARSDLLIADVNGPESPPGAALLIGAHAAAGALLPSTRARPSPTLPDASQTPGT